MTSKPYVIIVTSSSADRRGSIAERLSPLLSITSREMIFVSRASNYGVLIKWLSRILGIFLKANNAVRLLLMPKYKARTVDLKVFGHFAILAIRLISWSKRCQPDVVHLVEPCPVVVAFCRSEGIRCIYELNTSMQAYFAQLKARGGQYEILEVNKYVDDAQSSCLAGSDSVIVPSLFVLDQLPKEVRTKTSVIPYYLDDFLKLSASFQEHTTKAPLVVGLVGNMTPNKGLAEFVALSKRLSQENIRFKVFGRLYRNSIELPPQVECMGFKPREEIYSQINLLLSLSWGEGSTRVVYEAISRGVPVLCTFESGAPFPRDAKWVALHTDLPHFERILRELATRRAELHHLLSEQSRLLEEFTKARYVEKLEELYGQLAS
jgi:glycosyltransferase involved in cell wall biosynthesis